MNRYPFIKIDEDPMPEKYNPKNLLNKKKLPFGSSFCKCKVIQHYCNNTVWVWVFPSAPVILNR